MNTPQIEYKPLDRTFQITVTVICSDRETATKLRDEIASNLASVRFDAGYWVGSVNEASEDLAQLETLLETIKTT